MRLIVNLSEEEYAVLSSHGWLRILNTEDKEL